MHTAVLIAGAGPTGLTLAIELARRNISFRIADAASEPFFGSRGKGIQPRTLEVFEDLGVLDAVRAAGGPYPRFRVHVWSTPSTFGLISAAASPAAAARQSTMSGWAQVHRPRANMNRPRPSENPRHALQIAPHTTGDHAASLCPPTGGGHSPG